MMTHSAQSRPGVAPCRPRPALALLLAAFAATPALAQQDDTRRLERAVRTAEGGTEDYRLKVDTNLSLEERTQLDVGGFFSFTGLFLKDNGGNNRRLFQYDTTIYARASLDGVHTGFVRVRFPYRDFSTGDSFDGRGDRWVEPFIDRYSYEFDYRRYVAAYEGEYAPNNFNLKVGRQFVDWGAGLALSEVLISVRPVLTLGDRWEVEGLAGVTPDTTVDFDASRAEFDTHTRRGYYGGKLQYSTLQGRRYYVFGLHTADYNTDSRLRNPLPGLTNASFDYNATYFGFGTEGSYGPDITYVGELVYQIGDTFSDPVLGVQQRDDISAFAARAEVSYLFRDANMTRAQFETLFATGDGDRTSASDTVSGNAPGTDDTGFNALGFANTGLAFAPSLSNLLSFRAGISTFPFPTEEYFSQLQIGADILTFFKAERNGGFDEPTKDRSYLGTELDLFANYRLTSDLAFNARYGAFIPGTAISGDKSVRNFVLLGFTLSF